MSTTPKRGSAAARHLAAAALAFGALLFTLAPVARAAQTAGPQSTLELYARLGAELDAATMSVDALGFALAFEDAETILDHVQRHVRYETYVGLLRGPDGTLVARAGNALDQAVLMARLLRDAGYDVRVALGELTDAEAALLVLSMFSGTRGQTGQPAADRQAAAERFAELTGAAQADVEAALAELTDLRLEDLAAYDDAIGARDLIVGALSAAGLGLGADLTAGLVSEARDYAWTEYRLGAGAAWTAAHPAWPAATAAPEPVAVRYLEDEVPEELQHRLRVEVMLERKRGDAFEVTSVMTPWERPVANMLGVTLSVGNTVIGEDAAASLAELGTDRADSAFFVPTLNGAMAPGALAFDTMGNVLAPQDAASAAAGVFQTTAGRVNMATGLLGALGTDAAPTEPFALTAQWVDYVLIAPGGAETRFRRYVFDRRTPEARVAGGLELQDKSVLLNGILTSQTFMVVGGAVAPEFLAAQLLEQASDYAKAIGRLGASSSAGAVLQQELMEAIGAVTVRDHLALIAGFDAVAANQGGVAYRASPTVVALYNSLTPGAAPNAATGVDIVANARRFLTREGGRVVADVGAAVLAGAWETAIERGYMQRGAREVHGAYAAFAGAGGAVVVAPGDLAALERLTVPQSALPAVAADLAAGYAVLLPEAGLAPDARAAWWRVNTATGETLGMGVQGRGNAATEYEITWHVSAALTAALSVPGALMCTTASSGAEMGKCLCDVAASAAIGMGVGALAGSLLLKLGSAGMIVSFLTFDIAAGTVSAIPGLLPGPCTLLLSSSRRDDLAQAASQACAAAA